MKSNKELMDEIEKKVARNLVQACFEQVQLKETGILPDGIIRAMARELNPVSSQYGLSIVLSMVANQAQSHIARYGL